VKKKRTQSIWPNLLLASMILIPQISYSAEKSNNSNNTQLEKKLEEKLKKQSKEKTIGDNVATAAIAFPGGGDEGGGDHTPSANEGIKVGLHSQDSITPETTQLLGEQIDLNGGSLSFAQTDISLPGNNNLPVSIGRSYRDLQFRANRTDFADWSLDIPYIRTTILADSGISHPWSMGKECSREPEIGHVLSHGARVQSSEYYNGETINVPGYISEKLLWKGNASYPKVTKSNWRIRCAPNATNTGEILIAESPSGVTYTFSEKVRRNSGVVSNNTGRIAKYDIYMYVSEVKDRFGNSVTYHYESLGGVNKIKSLVKISSNDGREITINRNLAAPNYWLITSVVANGRTWLYNYNSSGYKSLTSITRPDNKKWHFDLAGLLSSKTLRNECIIPSRQSTVVNMTHPNGVKGTFTLEATMHGQSNVEKVYNSYKQIHYTKKCTHSMSLVNKSLTGPGLPTMNWTYNYSENKGFYTNESTSGASLSYYPSAYLNSLDYKSTTVNAPDGSKTIYFHNRDYTSSLDGKNIVTEYYDTNGISLLKRRINNYVIGAFVGSAILEFVNTKPIDYRVNLIRSTTEMHKAGVNKIYYVDYSSFNAYGVPQITYEHNLFNSNKRYTKQEYDHDTTNYLLNLPTKTYVSKDNSYSGSELVSQQTYHSKTGAYKSLANKTYSFGRWVKQKQSYHTSGESKGLPKRTLYNAFHENGDSNPHRWSETSNYYRGVPRTIRTPQSTSTSSQYAYRTVDANGWVKSTIDFNGNSTSYSHDNLGRVTLINPADSKWNNTSIAYSHAYGGEESSFVYSGMLIKTTTKGNLESKVYFDGLYRPTLTKVRDKSDSSTTVYSRSVYNAYGKATYQSQPKNSLSLSYGTFITYDGLGRVTKSVNNALGGSGVRFSYAPESKVTVTDNRNLVTTTTYKAYGSPSQQQPISIITPSNLSNTSMAYNQFGNLTSITQGGITEHRVYDYYQNLCKTIRPDTGNTALSIDPIGNTTWLAHGISVSDSVSACDTSVYGNEKTTYSYDNLGALKTVGFGDSTPNKSYNYDKNGNLITLSFNGSTHSYIYNDLNLPTSESLSVDGYSWSLTHEYNTNANLKKTIYPSGTHISYSPNALGQAKAVGSYARDIDYFANGQLENMTQGNNCLNTQTLKTYGVPDIQRTVCNGSYIVNNQYSYDNNLNISRWNDLQDDAFDLKFTYDALDRLDNIKKYVLSSGGGNEYELMSAPVSTLAIVGTYPPTPPYPGPTPPRTGTWSTVGDMNYDAMGNITKFNFDGGQINYYYDNTKKLSSTSGSVSYSMGYDSRGNVTSNGNKSFSYNLANQMTVGDGNSYSYDGYDRRVKAIDSKGTRYSFYSQSGQLVFEQVNGVNRDNYYLGTQLVAYKNGSTVTYIHSDLLGSTAATTNRSGNVSTRSRYKPFGAEWGTAKNEIGYTGHKHDTDLGLTYMQARYYDPVIGRFYSNDPQSYSSENPVMSFNRYLYVNNNPYKYTDPNGEWLQLIGAAISASIEIAVQVADKGKVTSWTKVGVSAIAGAAGVGLGQKAAQLGSLLSNSSKVAATVSQVAANVTEAVAVNVIETSTNNIINSVTGANDMENINASGAATNAAVNTATGNIADNKIGTAGTKKANLFKGAVEGARKVAEELLKDD
jgi:RHS repeat-associated protein